MRFPGVALVLVLLAIPACGESDAESTTSTTGGVQEPRTIDGVWLLEGTDLVLDIVEDTATVDVRTDCARVLGSLTFTEGGDPTSFSLPGRDVTRCSPRETDRLDRAVALLGQVARVRSEDGGYRLLDGDGDPIGFLTRGG